jgi:hypothetical protein
MLRSGRATDAHPVMAGPYPRACPSDHPGHGPPMTGGRHPPYVKLSDATYYRTRTNTARPCGRNQNIHRRCVRRQCEPPTAVDYRNTARIHHEDTKAAPGSFVGSSYLRGEFESWPEQPWRARGRTAATPRIFPRAAKIWPVANAWAGRASRPPLARSGHRARPALGLRRSGPCLLVFVCLERGRPGAGPPAPAASAGRRPL